MIFETHGHYDDERYDEDRNELLAECENRGIKFIMNIGADMKSSRATVELANKYSHVYGAVGVHPSEVGDMTDKDIDELFRMAKSNAKVKAIGEIGLDYYYDDNPEKETQIHWFKTQLELAEKLSLPVVIHSRDAANDTMNIMKEMKAKEIGGVIHCYSYSVEQAREYVKMGFYIGIGGVITFSNSKKLKEVVADIPIENLVLETDSPYLTPVPYRGKRNSALYIPYIAEEIARIKNMPVEKVYEITFENGKRLYRM
ncbi:MAG: TatD family hydrolase [Coprococcus sp.]